MDVRVREDAHLRVDCPEPGRFRTARRYAFIVGAIGCFSASASAADQRYNLEIGAGSIPEALSEIEAMTKAALVWSPEQVVNAVTSGVSGVFTVEEALELVLRGTALRAERRNGLYVISPLRVTSADTEHHNSSDPRGNLSTSLAVADSRSQEFEHEEIVITGTRVVRDGFEAPTPVTVIDREYFNHYAPSNIADFVNFLPSIAGGVTPHQGGGGISNQTKGLNTLNLRGLGSNRTLILLDGVRVPATALDGSVDISQIPDALVQRVDVVTGGASAAHGSDALSGVINFVLDRSYTGVKGTIQGGITSYGDDGSYRVSLTSGFDFPSERGHLLLSAQTSYVSGIFHSDRDWNREGWMIMSNPSYSSGNGQPQHLLTREVGLSLATPGGLITSGPLKGIYFGQNGDPGQLTYGSLIANPLMSGGAWRYTEISRLGTNLDQRLERNSLFTRFTYKVADDVSVYMVSSYAEGLNLEMCCYQFNLGNLRISADNAFLPDQIARQMSALGLTHIEFGSSNKDLGQIFNRNRRILGRIVLGASGNADALGSSWGWDLLMQRGVSRSAISLPKVSITTKFNQAIDAVRDANGTVVCRSTISNPQDGCVPYNAIGTHVNSAAAIDYVTGKSQLYQNITQDMLSGSVQSEPFTSWAGPVTVVLGFEHRRESVKGISDPISLATGYFAGNYKPTTGSYGVTDAAFETVIPILRKTQWINAVDLNAAARLTSYSLSGFESTWKLGATYALAKNMRVRFTWSRDIRAPNMQELFAGGGGAAATLTDPFLNNATYNIRTQNVGNLGLRAERAITKGAGFAIEPLTGLRASVDVYDINISGAIAQLPAQTVIDRCYEGDASSCAKITRDNSGAISLLSNRPFNSVFQHTSGVDFEASFETALERILPHLPGSLSLRGLATHVVTLKTDDGLAVSEAAGSNASSGPAKWRWLLSATLKNDPLAITLSVRGVSAGVYSRQFIECTFACPPSTLTNMTISHNRIAGAVYQDLALNYRLANVEAGDVELFLTVQNVFDRDPPVFGNGPGTLNYLYAAANPLIYETLGRQFRAGMRFDF